MNYTVTSIFDIDYSKITVSPNIPSKSVQGHSYNLNHIYYDNSLNHVFSLPVLTFSQYSDPGKTPVLMVRLDEESKCTEELDKLLKHIKTLYCAAANIRDPDDAKKIIKGVYSGKNGKSILMQYYQKSQNGPGLHCFIPAVNADGSLCRKASGDPVFQAIDFSQMKGKSCRGVIEFKLGRISTPNRGTAGHKLSAYKVTCLKLIDPPVNKDIADYLNSEGVDDMLSRVGGDSESSACEEKVSESLSASDLNSMNASFDIAEHILESKMKPAVHLQMQSRSPPPQFQPRQQSFQNSFTLSEGSYQ